MGGKVNVHKWRFLLTRTKVRMIYIFTHICMFVEKKENAAFESNMEKTCVSTSASSLFSSLKSLFESLVTDFSFIPVQLNVKKGQCELFLSCDKLSLIIDVFLSRT